MYNYNLINPINITYRNPKQNPYTNSKEDEGSNGSAQKPVNLDENRGNQRQFPNGNKVQVDYTQNKVNIAQVVEDFKSTIAAINAPKEVADEVHLYLNLVVAESKKDSPSREIILSNLRNASKISDRFIEESLKKPSTVVEDWVNALFLQKVDLKSDPSFVNEAFRVQIPENKKAQGVLDNAAASVSIQNDVYGNEKTVNIAGGVAPAAVSGGMISVSANDKIPSAAANTVAVDNNVFSAFNTNSLAAENSLNKISSADDFQNMPLNIYDIPQGKITINEIKPIGQADGDYASYTAYEAPSGVSFTANEPQGAIQPENISENNAAELQAAYSNKDLTYSTTAPLDDYSSRGAVSFVETVESAPVDNGVYRLNAAIDTAQTLKEFSGVRIPYTPDNGTAQISFQGETLASLHGENAVQTPLRTVLSEKEQLARNNFVRAKRIIKENGDPYNALKLYDEALKLVQNSGDDNLKAAIHFERGKVFDDYDYAEYALQDYNRATKCSDNNLKTHAHLKMGRIYDDYVMFDPAVEQYSLAVETSEEAKNPAGKTKALRYLAGLFADRYDKENTEIFNSLSVDSAYETGNTKILAKTLMEAAENFEYVGEDIKALHSYKEAAKVLFEIQDYSMLSANYEAASDIMGRLGNEAKAMSLLSKALLYRQKAELQTA